MAEFVFETGESPEIHISCGGDLEISGWNRARVEIDDDDEDIHAELRDNVVYVNAENDCEIRVPHGAQVHVRRASSDLEAARFAVLEVEGVGGDMETSDIGVVRVAGIGGDLQVQHGELASLQGGTVAVGGDAEFMLPANPGQPFSVAAGGDLTCNAQACENATLRVRSSRGMRELRFGNGEPVITLTCGGDVKIKGAPAGAQKQRGPVHVEFDVDISPGEMVRQWWETWSRQGFGKSGLDRDVQRLSEQLRSKLEANLARMEARTAQAAAKAAKRGRWNWDWRNDGRNAQWKVNVPPAPRPPASPTAPAGPDAGVVHAEPVTDQERLAILRMVEQKKLTVEQAERLLRAMEG